MIRSSPIRRQWKHNNAVQYDHCSVCCERVPKSRLVRGPTKRRVSWSIFRLASSPSVDIDAVSLNAEWLVLDFLCDQMWYLPLVGVEHVPTAAILRLFYFNHELRIDDHRQEQESSYLFTPLIWGFTQIGDNRLGHLPMTPSGFCLDFS